MLSQFLKLNSFSIIAVAALILLWLSTIILQLFHEAKSFVLLGLASSVLFLILIFSIIAFRRYNSYSRDLKTNSLSVSSNQKHQTASKEILFVTQAYESVLDELKTHQQELYELQTQIKLRASSAEAFSNHIIANLPSGLIAFDSNGYIRVINEPAKVIFGITEESDLQNQSFENLFATSPKIVELLSETIRHNKAFNRFEVDYQPARQHVKKIGITITPLDISGKPSGALCLAADITEVVELREQKALQHNLESLGFMSAGLAHELKNSLATLYSYSQLIQRLKFNEQEQTVASSLTNEVRYLSQLVDTFLNFARPQQLTLTTVTFDSLLKSCLDEIQPFWQNKVIVKLTGIYPTVHADQILLRQTLINLLRNAFEAAAENKLNQLVKVDGSLFVDEEGKKWLVVEITDSGKGILEKDLPFVFVPFFTTKKQGHGIGLALAHRIVVQHGGTLSAANSLNEGAIFTLKLKI